VFCSIPGHIGIPDNETADAAGRDTVLYGDLSSERALDNDVCAYLICAVFSVQSDDCTHIQYNKLQAVKPSIDVWQPSSIYQEGGPTHMPSESVHSPDTWISVVR
jgi:hypothetical protein